MKAILLCKNDDINDLYSHLNERFKNIHELSKKRSQSIENYSKITIRTEIRSLSPLNEMTKILHEIPNIDIIAIQEVYE